jgi:hypothetical protein
MGTLDYVAPEQIARGPVDSRTDVYALGCVLHKSLTGEVPFPAEDVAAKLWAHLHEAPPLPSATIGVSEAFDEVVTRAMAKDPADRYQSALDLGRATLAAAQGRGSLGGREPAPVAAPRAGSGDPPTRRLGAATGVGRPAKPAGRRRWPLVLVAAVVIAAWMPVLIDRLGDDSSPAAQRFVERADEICAKSKHRYSTVAAQTPQTRVEAVDQAESLQRIAAHALDRLRGLRTPPELARKYRAYLAQRQLMVFQLGQARKAIQRGDVAGLSNAFARIDAQGPLRQQTATELGLHKCSGAG